MRKSLFLFPIIALVFLIGCNQTDEVASYPEGSVDLTAVVQTIYAQITETARVAALSATPTFTPVSTQTATLVPSPTPTSLQPTPIPTETLTVIPTATPTNTPLPTSSSGLPCNRANLETKSIADGTVIHINQTFIQTFRIKNTGSCTWDHNYELRFVDGDLLGAGASITMVPVGTIPTWGYAMVDVHMKAPANPGDYKGYWMIKAANGEIFGVGTHASNWFWVEVIVIDPDA